MATDGSLIFNTKIDTDGFEHDADKVSSKFVNLKNKIANTEAEISRLTQELEEMANTPIDSGISQKLERDIEKAKIKLNELYAEADRIGNAKQADLTDMGLGTENLDEILGRDDNWNKVQAQIESAEAKLRQYEAELRKVQSAEANTSGKDTAEYRKKQQKIAELNRNLELYQVQLRETQQKESQTSRQTKIANASFKHLDKGLNSVVNRLGKTSKACASLAKNGVSKLTNGIKRLTSNAKRSNSQMGSLGRTLSQLKGMLLSMVFFNLISTVMNSMTESMGQMSKESEDVNSKLSSLKTSLTYFKHTIASAFMPIVNVAVPILTEFIDTLSAVTNKVANFIAVLSGQSSYQKAVKVQQNYAESLEDTASSAEKATNNLASFDELNVMQENTATASSSDETENYFETVPTVFDSFADKLKQAFKKGDFKSIGKLVANKFNVALKSIKWNKIRSTAKTWASNIADFLNGAIEELDWYLTGTTIGNCIKTAIEFAYTFLKKFDWKEFGYSIVDFASGFFKSFDINIPVSKFKKAIDSLGKSFKNIYNNLLKPLAKWTIKKAVPTLVNLLADALLLLGKAFEVLTSSGGVSILLGISSAIFAFKSCTTVAGIISNIGNSIKLLGVAMTAHPYVAIIAGIAGAITGLVTAVKLSNEESWEALGFNEQAELMEGYLETITNCKEEIEGLCGDITTSLSETSADMMIVDNYKKRLEELLSKSNLSSEEQAELTTIGDYFCEKYPEFEAAWSQYIQKNEDGTISINGDLETVKESLTNIIDEYKRLAATSALSDLAQENTKANVKSQKSLNNAAVAYKKAEKALEDFKKEWNFDEDDLSLPGNYTWQSASGNNANVATLRKEYNELKNDVQSAEKEFNSAAEGVAQLEQNSTDLAKMQAVVNGNYEDASAVLMAYQAGLINTEDIQKSQWKSLSKLKKAAKDSGGNLVFGLSSGVNDYLDEVKEAALSTADMYLDTLNGSDGFDINSPSKKTYKSGASLIEGLVKGVSDNLFAPVNKIKELAGKIIKHLDFRTAFENIWSGIWTNSKLWINKIISGVEWFVNRFVDSINGIIDRLNSIAGTAGDLVGQDWKFDKIPKFSLPRLATGTVVPASYGEFLAVLGDNKREPEVVSPLSTIKQAVAEVMAENTSSGGDILINLTTELDGEKVFNKMIVYNNRYKKRHGRSAF